MVALNLSPEIRRRLREARNAVVFSGAGVSKESGLDTFRGDGGLWESMRPEELATPQAFARHPGRVWRWYAWRYAKADAAAPNPAHRELSRWATLFPSYTVVSQNVDSLHERAGSHPLKLHGSLATAHCNGCGRSRGMGEAIAASPDEPPTCACGGRFRPSVVWFGEPLPEDVWTLAFEATSEADLFVSVGTSAVVYPAAGLIELAHRAGALVIEVNPEPTPLSNLVDLRLAEPAGIAVPKLSEAIEECRS